MRLHQLEDSLQTQSQEHSKKIEELHKQQKKVRGGVSVWYSSTSSQGEENALGERLDIANAYVNRLPSEKWMCPLFVCVWSNG